MQSDKLFKILVIGGALLTSAGAYAQDAPEKQQAFCTSMDVCEEVHSCSAEGEVETQLRVKDGFTCCWGTSCADLEE